MSENKVQEYKMVGLKNKEHEEQKLIDQPLNFSKSSFSNSVSLNSSHPYRFLHTNFTFVKKITNLS